MRVATVMTTPALTIAPTATIAAAAAMMLDRHLSGLPVVDQDGTLVGILSEGDFLRRVELDTQRKRPRWLEFLVGPGRLATDYVQSHGRRVSDVMVRDVATVTAEASLEDAVALMIRRHVKRLPVVDGPKVVGILTRSDLLRALSGMLAQGPVDGVNDQQIRATVETELKAQSWNAAGLISVEVRAGVVELRGTVFDDRTRLAARVVAENVPGVTSVVDHLVWLEPMTGLVLPAADDPAEHPKATGG